MRRLFFLIALFFAATSSIYGANAPFKLGIEVLEATNFDVLKGHRVGILTHAAALDTRGRSSVDILANAPQVNLRAIYAPEHGLDGQLLADEAFDHDVHKATGLPVYSVYGATRKPTAKMLRDIDVMVIDLQDIGVRSYTFISAMKLAMEACFENGKAVVVLDRPNPLGGLKVDGPTLDPTWRSYVGMYEIPYIHGLTIGEIARITQSELKPRKGQFMVVPMQGWRRSMIWDRIPGGPKWTPTSPAIDTLASAFGYACTGLGAQLGGFRHGYGTEYSFRFLSHPKLSANQLKARLDRADLPGFQFITTKTKKGQEGVYVKITNWMAAAPIELSLTMLQIAQEVKGSSAFDSASDSTKNLFNKHWGRDEPLHTLCSRHPLNAKRLASHWRAQAYSWQAKVAKRFWLYQM